LMSKSARKYWLLKSEPDSYGINHLERDGKTPWDGIRNYQARNFIRDDMQVGDLALFYHSSSDPTGVAGVMEVIAPARFDPTALDPNDHHFDPKATAANPIWSLVDVKFVVKFPKFVTLAELKADRRFEGMLVLARGSRLSVQPVTEKHFRFVCELGGWKVK
jgi:predicted RNA-binding protein with PUA-like domain